MTNVEPSSDPPAAPLPSGADCRATPVGSRLAWNRLYRVASYVRSSLWVAPGVAIVLTYLRLRCCARSMRTSAVVLVFTFGSMLVAIQIAGG